MPNAEEQIRRAMEEGKFDDLPGKGKPLNLEQNPFEDPEWRLANQVLKSSGFSLPWIEKRKEIEARIRLARTELKSAQEEHTRTIADGVPEHFTRASWNEAQLRFRKQAAEINRLIRSYNLEVPATQLQMAQISIERELELTSSTPSDTLPD